MQTTNPMQITINKEPIRLSQFLKLANLVQDGIEAKIRILEKEVTVNKVLETRRGRKLYHGDTIQFNNAVFQVVKQQEKTP